MAVTTDALNKYPKTVNSSGIYFQWTKSDTNYISWTPTGGSEVQAISRGLSVDTAGSYKITDTDGQDSTVYLIAGVIHPIAAKRVYETGSQGSSIVVVYL